MRKPTTGKPAPRKPGASKSTAPSQKPRSSRSRAETPDQREPGASVWPGKAARSSTRARPAAATSRHAADQPARPFRRDATPPRAATESAAPRTPAPHTPAPRRERAGHEAEHDANRDGVVERKLYGINACLAFMRQRGDDIIRAYFVADVARQHFGRLMKLLAETRRAYHIVDADEMQKVTDSTHHEGVCLLVRDAPVLRIGDWLAQAHAASETVLALEDVGNPHNLGAIMRTAAHFGVAAIMVSGAERLRSGAAMRTAAGGAENVPLVEAAGFIAALKALKSAGYAIVTTSSHKGQSVFAAEWPSRACIVMGEEQRGVSRAVQALADHSVSIPGTGAVESLNVSVATAIVVAQCANAQQAARRTTGTLRKPKKS